MEASVHIEKITTADSFEELVPEWSRLWERSPGATPFQRPEWLLNWWRYMGGGALRVLLFLDRGRLVGLAPIFVHQWQEGRIRRLSWIGSGISDHLDILAESDFSRTGSAALFQYLRENPEEWDIADFQDLGPDSPMLHSYVLPGLRGRLLPAGICPVFSLPESVEVFRVNLSKNQKRNLARARRKLETSGELWVRIALMDDLPSAMEDLFRLHEARWKKRNLPGMLAEPAIRDFHRQAASELLKTGYLRLYSLQFNGKTIASLYALVKGDRVYGYLSGFDPQMERSSPGTLLLNYILEDSIHRGMREFDFLRGTEGNKYLWGARDRLNYRLVVWHSEKEIRIGKSGEVTFS